jgi:hypothetical protein
MLQAARAVKESARLLVRDLDPDAVPLCAALDLWKEFVEIGRPAASGATLMAGRVEEADAWRKVATGPRPITWPASPHTHRLENDHREVMGGQANDTRRRIDRGEFANRCGDGRRRVDRSKDLAR